MKKEIIVKQLVGEKMWCDVTISVQLELIMIHADGLSCQWPLDGTGVQISNPPDRQIMQVGFHSTTSQSYQSFFFRSDQFEELEAFFKGYGFPVPRPMYAGFEESQK